MRERGREVRGISGASRRKQEVPGGSRRWPRPLGRAPRLASAYWQRRKATGEGGGGGLGQREELGRAGKQVSGPGGRLPFYFCSVLFFSISAICF